MKNKKFFTCLQKLSKFLILTPQKSTIFACCAFATAKPSNTHCVFGAPKIFDFRVNENFRMLKKFPIFLQRKIRNFSHVKKLLMIILIYIQPQNKYLNKRD